jgi:hypothetical protein
VTLHGLAGQRDVDAVLAALRLAGLRRFDTVARRGAGGPVLLWDGDAEYDGEAPPGEVAASRHRLEIGALPWIYTRTD